MSSIPTPIGLPLQYGICVPNTCNTDDINNLVHNILEASLSAQIGIGELVNPFGPFVNETRPRLTLESHNETDHVVESIFRCHEHVSGRVLNKLHWETMSWTKKSLAFLATR